MATILLIGGTWDRRRDAWWRPGSPFVRALAQHGHALAAPDDPYTWSQDLDGVGSMHDWEAAGHALRWWLGLHADPRPDAIVAHSHGGTVAAFGLARLPAAERIPRLMTLGMPVRGDLWPTYEQARAQGVAEWIHVYTGSRDLWQWLGDWFDGSWRLRRRLAIADHNVKVPGLLHRELVTPDVWDGFNLWRFLA
jgi:hypothetical protein